MFTATESEREVSSDRDLAMDMLAPIAFDGNGPTGPMPSQCRLR
jgi:hypothetical protein